MIVTEVGTLAVIVVKADVISDDEIDDCTDAHCCIVIVSNLLRFFSCRKKYFFCFLLWISKMNKTNPRKYKLKTKICHDLFLQLQ